VFVELAGPDGEQVAIRDDGVFLWRRRLLPITAVASVFPERRIVVLDVDRRLLPSELAVPHAVAGSRPSAEEAADPSDQWQERVARYVSTGVHGTDEASPDRNGPASKQSTQSSGPALPPARAARQPAPETSQRDQRDPARHLLFVSTSRGYLFVEQEGPPPTLGQAIEVPRQPGSFQVAKLARSPLPNDQRICVYLEQTE
jgi:hypothetical protein